MISSLKLSSNVTSNLWLEDKGLSEDGYQTEVHFVGRFSYVSISSCQLRPLAERTNSEEMILVNTLTPKNCKHSNYIE